MRAWEVTGVGEPVDVLAMVERPTPEPARGELLIEVGAWGLNFSDILLCRGTYQERPTPPFTPGSEVAGTVIGAGSDTSMPVGTRVVARPRPPDGGLASVVAVPHERVHEVPSTMDDATAAALFVTYQTAWFALHRRADIAPTDTVLVHAAAGATGGACVQVARAAGARVVATAGGSAKCDLVRTLGAHRVVDYREDDFVEAVRSETGGRGADIVIDPVGGDTFDRSLRALAFEGRIVIVGFAGGTIGRIRADHVFVKNISVLGLQWPRYEDLQPELVAQAHHQMLSAHASGAVDARIAERRPFTDAPAALEDIAHRRTSGKVVLHG